MRIALLLSAMAAFVNSSVVTGLEGVDAFDIAGRDVTRDPAYLAGTESLYYSPLSVDDPSRLERLIESPGSTFVLRFRQASVTRTGESVMMEGRNTTDYRPANRDVNGIMPGSSLVQVNLAPVFDTSGTGPGFEFAQDLSADLQSRFSFDATRTNMVALWYRFVSETTGQPIELEEFSITFFDFPLPRLVEVV